MAMKPAASAQPRDRGPWPEDSALRRFGFRIHTRSSDSPPVWILCGVLYTHDEALRVVDRKIKSVATK